MNIKGAFLLGFLTFSTQAEIIISDKFISAIWQVESGGRLICPDGDLDRKTGLFRAKGPLQIHKACWQDAINFNPKIGGQYNDCTNLNYSIKIFKNYQEKYKQKTGLKQEQMAKLWNGGCNYQKVAKTPTKAANLNKYWLKVQTALAKAKSAPFVCAKN